MRIPKAVARFSILYYPFNSLSLFNSSIPTIPSIPSIPIDTLPVIHDFPC
jgi:hypothetical protein